VERQAIIGPKNRILHKPVDAVSGLRKTGDWLHNSLSSVVAITQSVVVPAPVFIREESAPPDVNPFATTPQKADGL
jgi:hypothetical protein